MWDNVEQLDNTVTELLFCSIRTVLVCLPAAMREQSPHPGKKALISSTLSHVRGSSTTSVPLVTRSSADSRVVIVATPLSQIKEPGEVAAASLRRVGNHLSLTQCLLGGGVVS